MKIHEDPLEIAIIPIFLGREGFVQVEEDTPRALWRPWLSCCWAEVLRWGRHAIEMMKRQEIIGKYVEI